MSKVTFEMDGDEYIKLMSFIKEDTLENWQTLKQIKDQCPVIYKNTNTHHYSFCEVRTNNYFSKDFIFNEILKEYNKSEEEFEKEFVTLRKELALYKNTTFFDRLKFLFTGKII